MSKIATVAMLVVLFRPVSSFGSQEISLRVNPTTFFVYGDGRASPRLLIRIENHAGNRLIRLEWDSSDGEAGSSEKTLEGKNSQVVFTGEDFLGRTGLALSAGYYQIRVTLIRIATGEEKKYSAQMYVNILRAE